MRILITGGSGFIGTHVINAFSQQINNKADIINLDISKPRKDSHQPFWRQCNILDREHVADIVARYHPTHVLHLAAKADTDGRSLQDYAANTEGTRNVLDAVKASPDVQRVIITSTMYVCRPGCIPEHDEVYDPHTIYGESKVITEQLTRSANLPCSWTIIRPSNIWGAWHPRYPYEFWRVLSRGMYLHPGTSSPLRCYGYVRNVVHQINTIFTLPVDLVHEQTFYTSDPPVPLLDWVNGFACALTGKQARVVPTPVVRALAYVGDAALLVGMRFPIQSSRFRSMTEDYLVPMEQTLQVLGEPLLTLQEGIKETAEWLRETGFVKKIYV